MAGGEQTINANNINEAQIAIILRRAVDGMVIDEVCRSAGIGKAAVTASLSINPQTIRMWRVFVRHLRYIKAGCCVPYSLPDVDAFLKARIRPVSTE